MVETPVVNSALRAADFQLKFDGRIVPMTKPVTEKDLRRKEDALMEERNLRKCQELLKKQGEGDTYIAHGGIQAAIGTLALYQEDELNAKQIGRAETVMPEMTNAERMQQAFRQTVEMLAEKPVSSLPDGKLLCARA